MIELTIGDLHKVIKLATVINPSDGFGEMEVPMTVGPDENRRSILVTGLGIKIDPQTPQLPAPETV